VLTEGASLLALIEEANYEYSNIRKIVQARIEECQKQIEELKAMSQEQFLAMISKSMFGVAMKEYYIDRLEKRIESLKALPEHIDNLLEYWRTSRNGYFHDSIKYYKPYVRQLKQAFEKLGQNRFNSKLPSFSILGEGFARTVCRKRRTDRSNNRVSKENRRRQSWTQTHCRSNEGKRRSQNLLANRSPIPLSRRKN